MCGNSSFLFLFLNHEVNCRLVVVLQRKLVRQHLGANDCSGKADSVFLGNVQLLSKAVFAGWATFLMLELHTITNHQLWDLYDTLFCMPSSWDWPLGTFSHFLAVISSYQSLQSKQFSCFSYFSYVMRFIPSCLCRNWTDSSHCSWIFCFVLFFLFCN